MITINLSGGWRMKKHTSKTWIQMKTMWHDQKDQNSLFPKLRMNFEPRRLHKKKVFLSGSDYTRTARPNGVGGWFYRWTWGCEVSSCSGHGLHLFFAFLGSYSEYIAHAAVDTMFVSILQKMVWSDLTLVPLCSLSTSLNAFPLSSSLTIRPSVL